MKMKKPVMPSTLNRSMCLLTELRSVPSHSLSSIYRGLCFVLARPWGTVSPHQFRFLFNQLFHFLFIHMRLYICHLVLLNFTVLMIVVSGYTASNEWEWYMWECRYWFREGKLFFQCHDLHRLEFQYKYKLVEWNLMLVYSSIEVMVLQLFHYADSCLCAAYFGEITVPSKTCASDKGSYSYPNQRVGSSVSVILSYLLFIFHIASYFIREIVVLLLPFWSCY